MRIIFIAIGAGLALAAAGYFWRLPWALYFWPWEDSRLSYIFLASILAASAASLIYIGLSGELRAAAPGALNVTISAAGAALAFFGYYQADPANPRLLLTAVGLAFAAVFTLGVFWWARGIPLRDTRPAGRLVQVSFLIFVFALSTAAGLLVMRYGRVFPWPLNPRSSVIFGLIFAGNLTYFFYYYLEPYRVMALGQLWGFLAYDVVLIGPFLQHIETVRPEHRTSLTIYLLVLVYSAAVAVITLAAPLVQTGAAVVGAKHPEG